MVLPHFHMETVTNGGRWTDGHLGTIVGSGISKGIHGGCGCWWKVMLLRVCKFGVTAVELGSLSAAWVWGRRPAPMVSAACATQRARQALPAAPEPRGTLAQSDQLALLPQVAHPEGLWHHSVCLLLLPLPAFWRCRKSLPIASQSFSPTSAASFRVSSFC